MTYEQRRHSLLSWPRFVRRAGRHLLYALVIASFAIGLGTLGYHTVGHLGWIDAFLNASMILSGMGPVDRMTTNTSKMFSALYALFSGLVFLAVAGVIVAPWVHRLFHWFHLEER